RSSGLPVLGALNFFPLIVAKTPNPGFAAAADSQSSATPRVSTGSAATRLMRLPPRQSESSEGSAVAGALRRGQIGEEDPERRRHRRTGDRGGRPREGGSG